MIVKVELEEEKSENVSHSFLELDTNSYLEKTLGVSVVEAQFERL